MFGGHRRGAAVAEPHPHCDHASILVDQGPMNGELGTAIPVTATLDEGCRWARIGGRVVCDTHQQLGQRLGLGKLYRVVTAEGTQLVRAPDPTTAKAAVDGSSVERALPHEADGRTDVLDTRELVHWKSVPPTRRGRPRPWAEPQPRQFADPSMPIECSLSGWEQLTIAPSVWERGLARVRAMFVKTPGASTPRAR